MVITVAFFYRTQTGGSADRKVNILLHFLFQIQLLTDTLKSVTTHKGMTDEQWSKRHYPSFSC
ncbi:hypothetical protein THOE12_50400 [Vibrio rotiferianus]|nr:hypothetical protein THOE12_50400 [Vibrio rotiferianus]